MKKLLLALLILICFTSYSQTTGYLRYDSVKVMKQNGNSNLIIENATRDTLGFLYNYGGGRTRFDRIRAVPGGIKVGDDTILINSGGFFSPDQTATGTTTHDLNGQIFNLISGGEYFIYLDPTPGAETSFFQAYNQTGNDNFAQLANSATNTSAQSLMAASFNASKQAFVILNASSGVSLANIIADSAKLEINRTVPISIADSALHWMMVMDRATGMLRPAHWPSGGGSGIDSNAYRDMIFINDSTVGFVDAYGNVDSLVYSAGTSSGGVSNFIDLADGPGAFTGQAGKVPIVNPGETALIYYTIPTAGDVTKVGTPVNNYLGVWTGDGTIEGDADLQFNGTQLGIQGVPGYALDIWTGTIPGIVVGADATASTRTNNTNKFGTIAMPSYANATLPLTLIRGAAGTATNTVVVGGGVAASSTGAQAIEFYTSATPAASAFSKRADVTLTAFRINSDLNDYNFTIGGDTDANLFVADANGLTAGAIGIGTAAPATKLDVVGVISTDGLNLDRTITAGGTTGNQTINKVAGTVNFATGTSTITVTNSLVTTSSLIFCTIRTDDAAALIKNVVAGSGSFVITLNAATGAETSVGFLVTN